MGLPETASQCLCPLGQGGDTGSGAGTGADTENSQRDRRPALILDPQSSLPRQHRKDSAPSPSQSLPTPPLRRSTFYDGGNAQQCIEACRRGFLSALTLTATPSPLPLPSASSIGIVNSDDGVSLPAACSVLSGPAVQQELWQLYWCDAAFCGVWIAADGGTGQDPNVDLFINECQNIGYHSIYDPGPPPTDYYCSSLLAAGPSANPCRTLSTASATAIASNNLAAPPVATATATAIATAAATTPTAPTMAATHPTTAAVTGIASSGSTSAATHGTPTPGAKAAIAICSVLAAALLAALVYFFVNKRRSSRGARPHQHQGSMGGGGMVDGGGRGSSGGEMGTVSDAHADAAEFGEFSELGEYGECGEYGGRGGRGERGNPSTISLKTRLRQSRMLFLPGHLRGAAARNSRHPRQPGGEVPTPLISPANSCSSVPGVINSAGPTSLQKFQLDGGDDAQRSGRSLWSFVLSPSLFSRRDRQDRSVSPPLTSLSPPPSPTQLSARGSGTEQAGSGRIDGNNAGFYSYSSSPVPYYFPSSPICAPTTNKLEPRRERTPTMKPNKSAAAAPLTAAAAKPKPPQALGYYNFQGSHQLSYSQPDRHSAAESAGTAGSARGLRSSYGSYSTATNASIPASSLYGNALTSNMMEPMTPVPGLPAPPSPASPARPPRPHESPLEIPDLVMPDPPPLPPPPRGTRASASASASRSFSMPASAFSFSSLGGRKNLSGSHPPPPPPRVPPAMTLSAPAPLPAPMHDIVYANSLDSFSSHPAAIANAKAGLSRMNPKDPILPAGPPPNRALPSPPPPPPVPPMSSKRLSGTASLASMARSLSLSPQPPPPQTVPEDGESIASFELPPLLMRDDPDDGPWAGKTAKPGLLSSRPPPQDGSAPSKAQTSSFSSTMSASSMLSSSTADTMASMTTSSTMATRSMTATAAPVLAVPGSTPLAAEPSAVATLFYKTMSTASSSLTIKPEKVVES